MFIPRYKSWDVMKVYRDISCIVLAGGKSSRLKSNKVLEIVGERILLERVVNIMSSFDRDILIVTAKKQSFPQLAGHKRLRIVADIYPDKGVLGGIYTGLCASNSFYNLVVASDMPFLNQALLRYMIGLAYGFEAVVPQLNNSVEPLHAVYSKSCLTPMEWQLKQCNLKTSDVLSLIKARYLEAKEIDRFDPEHLSIFNINTKADLAEARELAKEIRCDVKCGITY